MDLSNLTAAKLQFFKNILIKINALVSVVEEFYETTRLLLLEAQIKLLATQKQCNATGADLVRSNPNPKPPHLGPYIIS